MLYSGHVRLFSHLYYIKKKKYQGNEEPKYITVFDSLAFTQDNFTNLMYGYSVWVTSQLFAEMFSFIQSINDLGRQEDPNLTCVCFKSIG